MADRYLVTHRAHDYDHIVRRWRKVARSAGLAMEAFADVEGYPVYALTGGEEADEAFYISTGVHGDEPAAVNGLLEWAEENVARLRDLPLMILPCFNPWGLVNNSRLNAKGEDLNRSFHKKRHPHMRPWFQLLKGRRFSVAVSLHEDYDANGIYLYEIKRGGGKGIGSALLAACEKVIPREAKPRIEGREAKNGVLFRRRIPVLPGQPEAIVLFLENTDHTLTFETPSEFGLEERVRAHRAFMEATFARFCSR